MKKKIPILLLTKDRPTLLEKVLDRIIKHTDWNKFDLWILDNLSTFSNKKIINMFKANYPFINVHSTTYNQLALIQNEVIGKIKADFYIKVDDDILVTENWTDGFVGVFERNHDKMSFGSVIMPINGFGWLPFLEIMNLVDEFKSKFPDLELTNQIGVDDFWKYPEKKFLDILTNAEANEFLWNKCLDLDATAKTFVANQNGTYKDLLCPIRYSIGAIVFSHAIWAKMGGWRVQDDYPKRLKKQKLYKGLSQKILNFKKVHTPSAVARLEQISDLIAGTAQGAMGLEEQEVYMYSLEKGYTMPITTQPLAFHFAFGKVDQHLMNTVYKKIKF